MAHRATPAQIAFARFDEARQLLDAWNRRLEAAEAAHLEATETGGNVITTKLRLNASTIQHEDAVAYHHYAQQAWINSANKELWPARRNAA